MRHGEREREPVTRLVGEAVVPLEWDLPLEPEAQLEETRRLAVDCVSACKEGARLIQPGHRPAVIALAGTSSLVAERVEAEAPDMAALLGLCIQVVDSFEPRLDEIGESASGLLVASAARRCAQSCSRALMALAPELY